MPRGGIRPGGGRPKGAKGKFDKELSVKAASEGVMPLDYMLGVMRNESEEGEMRLEAAKAAAPYVHKKQPQDLNVSGNMTYTPAPVNKLALPAHLAEKMSQ